MSWDHGKSRSNYLLCGGATAKVVVTPPYDVGLQPEWLAEDVSLYGARLARQTLPPPPKKDGEGHMSEL